MNCPNCSDSRMGVSRTIQWEGEVWRARRCPDCSSSFPSVERLAPAWPVGVNNSRAKRAAVRERASAGREDVFGSSAGADLAGLMRAFVAPTQQNDQD